MAATNLLSSSETLQSREDTENFSEEYSGGSDACNKLRHSLTKRLAHTVVLTGLPGKAKISFVAALLPTLVLHSSKQEMSSSL